jgi:hypothetical protein
MNGWLARIIVLVKLVFLFSMWVVTIGMLASCVILNPLLPQRWRIRRRDRLSTLDGAAGAQCPICQRSLAVGRVDERQRVIQTKWGDLYLAGQSGDCPQCRRSFSRLGTGIGWGSWNPRR